MTSYRLLESYPAAPGKCISCGGVNTPVLDTAISIDFYGAVMFCINCAKDLGRNAGLTEPIVLENVQTEAAKEFLSNVSAKFDHTNGLLNDLHSYVLSHAMVLRESETGESEASGGSSEQTDGQVSDNSLDEGPTSLSSSPSDAKQPTFNLS